MFDIFMVLQSSSKLLFVSQLFFVAGEGFASLCISEDARRSHCIVFFWEQDLERIYSLRFCSCSHLAGRDELQRSQGNLEVGSVGLEIVESLSNVLLKLGGVLPRRAVGGDLVQGLGAHLDVWWTTMMVSTTVVRSDWEVLRNWKRGR